MMIKFRKYFIAYIIIEYQAYISQCYEKGTNENFFYNYISDTSKFLINHKICITLSHVIRINCDNVKGHLYLSGKVLMHRIFAGKKTNVWQKIELMYIMSVKIWVYKFV